jgi:hypothetical protein
MDETNLLSLIRPWLDTNYQITTKFATVPFCKKIATKSALNETICKEVDRSEWRVSLSCPGSCLPRYSLRSAKSVVLAVGRSPAKSVVVATTWVSRLVKQPTQPVVPFAVIIKKTNEPALSSQRLGLFPSARGRRPLRSTSFSRVPSASSSSPRPASPVRSASSSSSSFSPRVASDLRSLPPPVRAAARRSGSDRPTGARAAATSARILRGAWSLASSSVARELPRSAAASPSSWSTTGLPSPPGVGAGIPFPVWIRRRQPAPCSKLANLTTAPVNC